jgi:hypothetical protein
MPSEAGDRPRIMMAGPAVLIADFTSSDALSVTNFENV